MSEEKIGIKFQIEYPWPCYTNRDPDVFRDITMFSMQFMTCFHYFKNHDNQYTELSIRVLGFGFRITEQK